jgi:hypothetical protein
MESPLPDTVQPMTEREAMLEIIGAVESDNVWLGERLEHRWEVMTDGK